MDKLHYYEHNHQLCRIYMYVCWYLVTKVCKNKPVNLFPYHNHLAPRLKHVIPTYLHMYTIKNNFLIAGNAFIS